MLDLVNKPTQRAALATVIMMASALSCSSPAVMANSNSASAIDGSVNRPIKRFTGQQNFMYQTQELKAPISVPNLPAYQGSGAAYTSGICYPNLKGRQCYIMRYAAKESSLAVMRMYKDSLLQNGWQINDKQTNCKQLTATKKNSGVYLTLCTYPSSNKPGFNSSFEIKYLTTGSVQGASI